MYKRSLCINYSMAECFPGELRWCSFEQVCQARTLHCMKYLPLLVGEISMSVYLLLSGGGRRDGRSERGGEQQ